MAILLSTVSIGTKDIKTAYANIASWQNTGTTAKRVAARLNLTGMAGGTALMSAYCVCGEAGKSGRANPAAQAKVPAGSTYQHTLLENIVLAGETMYVWAYSGNAGDSAVTGTVDFVDMTAVDVISVAGATPASSYPTHAASV